MAFSFNLGSLASFGTGFARGRDQAEEKKKRDRQQLLALTQRTLQARQAGRDRAAALTQRQQEAEQRRAGTAATVAAKGQATAATAALQKEKAQHQKEVADAGLLIKKQGLQVRGLGEYTANAGNGRYANMTPAQQAAAVQALNTTAGTSLPVPGDPTGRTRPRDYGLPPAQADGVNAAINLYGGETPTAPETVPYFQPNADQAGKRQAVAATAAGRQAQTRIAPQRLQETQRHNKASEGTARAGLGERSRHDAVAEGQGEERIGQGAQRVQQGDARIGQGAQRISIAQMRALGVGGGGAKGQPTFGTFQAMAEHGNAQKNKVLSGLRIWDPQKKAYATRAATPTEQSMLDAADAQIRQAQHGQRAVSRGVSPVTGQSTLAPFRPAGVAPGYRLPHGDDGAAIGPLPGFGPGPSAAAPVHHSHAQPRRQTGEFKPGKPGAGRPGGQSSALDRLRALGIH